MSTATRVPISIRRSGESLIAEANGVEVARLELGEVTIHPLFADSDVEARLREFESDDARPIVAVDLNGVLDVYGGWVDAQHWDPPRPGAAEFLDALAARGYRAIVHTTRWPADAEAWLRAHGLRSRVAGVTGEKVPAHVFVDDRAICFRGDFEETLREIDRFRAHWESSEPHTK